ncbi:hypothetical protein C493_01595 [Natronolimnohabitans innermongolicus JCM 12255]|uniref:DUF7344 domain-containing protein n=2 Tax=Natronolimnohabitans innermongolicus TaxID=253107 RepID=L9XMP2_9EURY|nr:hypothetical protein C493_01595 [Natronolimnohabitans innermongolicus JCM 12255]
MDEIFHILQTNRRRDAIEYLLDHPDDDPVKMSDVAEFVAAKEHETTIQKLTSAQRQRVYIPLYQSHLPKLDEKNLIEYDKSRGIIRTTDRLEIFRPYLEVTDPVEGPSRSASDSADETSLLRRLATDSYATTLAVSTGLFVASTSGLLVLPELTLAAIIILLFVLTTILTNVFPSPSRTDVGDHRPSH